MAPLIQASSLLLLLLTAGQMSAAEAVPDPAAEARAQATRTMFQSRITYADRLKQFDRLIAAQELPRLIVHEGQLETTPCTINTNPAQRIKVIGSEATWVLGAAGMGINITSLEYINPAQLEGDGIWNAVLNVRPGSLFITIRRGWKSPTEYHTITQRKDSFNVIVRNSLPRLPGAPLGGQMQSLRAESFEQFRQKSPAEFEQYVKPVVELLGLAGLLKPGPADIYRVFSEIQPSPESERRLLEIVAALASVDPAQRTAASQQLEKLGPPGVLAALRLDRSILTPEQSSRIDTFLRSQSSQTNNPQRLRHEPLFLVDCLESDDLEVRKLALAELKVALNRDVSLDFTADAESLRRAVAGLRKQIAVGLEKGSVKPIVTTQPAANPPSLQLE